MNKMTTMALTRIMGSLVEDDENMYEGTIALLNIFDKPLERKLILDYFSPSKEDLERLIEECHKDELEAYDADAQSENSTGNLGEYGDMLHTIVERAKLKIAQIDEVKRQNEEKQRE